MRFIPINCLKEGMILDKSLYDNLHNLLLRKGHKLKLLNINRIKNLGYEGVYIHVEKDELSVDIETEEVIKVELRQNIKKLIKNSFINFINEKDNTSFNKTIIKLVDEVFNNLLINPTLMINLHDLKSYDDYTYKHSINVAIISVVIGSKYGFSKLELYELGYGALMHDIGKEFISIKLLHKKTSLDREDLAKIKMHPDKGAMLLREYYGVNESIIKGVLHHHEKYDGSGYPLGLKGKEISLYGRIIALCDIFDALTSNRAYRKAISPDKAIEYISGKISNYFDNEITNVFLNYVTPYPIGTVVRLSNGYLGVVTNVKPGHCLCPEIKVIRDNNKALKDVLDIDLEHEKDIKIIKVIDYDKI